MLFQLFIFIIVWIFESKYNDNTSNEAINTLNRRKFITLVMALFAFQSGLRNLAVGPDTYQYYNHFEDAILSPWSDLLYNFTSFLHGGGGKDPGYALAQKIFGTLLPSYRLYLISVAVFFFYALGKTLIRYTSSNREILVSVALYQCLYYSFFSITGIRQTIASSILLLAIPFAINRKWWKFGLMVLVAATQHKSALLFFPFYFLPMLKDSKKIMIVCLCSFIPMWIFGGEIARSLVVGSVFEQYAGYLEQNEVAGAYMFALYMLLLGVLTLWKNKKVLLAADYNYLFINAVAVAILLTPLTMIDPSNMRIVQYYSVFGLIVLPQCMRILGSGNGVKNIERYVFLFLAVYTLYRMESYAFFWQDMTLGINYGEGIINDSVIRF